MKRSNVEFTKLCDILYTNKSVIDFNDEVDEIPIEGETKSLVCIGNRTRHNLKIQFSVIEGCDRYEIRTEPQLITVNKGQPCEFEIFITPLCSCTLDENIKVIVLDIEKGVENIFMTMVLCIVISNQIIS